MNKVLMWSLIVAAIHLTGCASTQEGSWRMPEGDEGSTAPGAAFAGDAITFRKDMPKKQEPTRFDFFYKRCSMVDDSAPHRRNSYDCAGPAF